MFKKLLKTTLITTACVTTTAMIFPDYFTPVQKVVNVAVAGGQIFYVYKYTKDTTI